MKFINLYCLLHHSRPKYAIYQQKQISYIANKPKKSLCFDDSNHDITICSKLTGLTLIVNNYAWANTCKMSRYHITVKVEVQYIVKDVVENNLYYKIIIYMNTTKKETHTDILLACKFLTVNVGWIIR